MASLIEGYEYDIFISYRQKDNKHDGWVTEFVDNLKGELESTFKENVSVYFDINLHDGLLETHDVDESLKNKLKCLVFIPIISRTYCDPKSFAWEHELKTFVELASQDQFGSKVKLPNGNVANRVLPVLIHDLDESDIKECESVLRGVLRSVEFIFKSAGVNRPLRSQEENPHDNLNHTIYRDQINKVALAIKELIVGIKESENQSQKISKEQLKLIPEDKRYLKTKIFIGSIILFVLLVLVYIFIPQIFKPSEPGNKSIAVLPFANLSNDPEQEYFSDGMVEAILTHLFKVGELKVISSTSSKRYKNTKLSIKDIARELGVSSILEGSVQKIGNNIRITVQLIDANTDGHIWSEIYDKNISDIFKIQTEVAQNVARELKMTLTNKEIEQIEKSQTRNLAAYNLYLQGRFFWNKRTPEGLQKSIDYFKLSISEDPNYALAYAGLADAYHIQTWWGWGQSPEGYEKAKEFALKALEIDENLAEAHATLGSVFMWNEWNWKEAQKEFDLAVELNPNCAYAHQYYSEFYEIMGDRNNTRTQINYALKVDPLSPVMNFLSGRYYYYEGKIEESLSLLKKVLELSPDYRAVYITNFNIYVKQGEDQKAIYWLKKHILSDTVILRDTNTLNTIYDTRGIKGIYSWLIETSPGNNFFSFASNSAILEEKEKTLTWLEQAVENHESNIPRINSIPDFDYLRSEPRFKALIKKMGLSEY